MHARTHIHARTVQKCVCSFRHNQQQLVAGVRFYHTLYEEQVNVFTKMRRNAYTA